MPSRKVRPPRIAEAPIAMECRLDPANFDERGNQIVRLSDLTASLIRQRD